MDKHYNKPITRGALIRNVLITELVVSISIFLIMSGVLAYAGVPLLFACILFYIYYMKLWKSFKYSDKLLNAITFLNIILVAIFTLIYSGR